MAHQSEYEPAGPDSALQKESSFLGNLFSALGSKAWELDEHLTGGAIGDKIERPRGPRRVLGAGVRGLVERSENIERRMEAMQYIKDQGWLTDEAYASLEKIMSHPEGPIQSMITESFNELGPGQSTGGTFFGPSSVTLPQSLRRVSGEYPDIEGVGYKRSVEELAHTIMHEFGHFLDQSGGSLDVPFNKLGLGLIKQQLGPYVGINPPTTLSAKMAKAEGLDVSAPAILSETERPAPSSYTTTSRSEHLADRFAEAAKEARENIASGKQISRDLQETILRRPDMREAFRNAIPGFNDWLWRTGDLGDDPSVIGEFGERDFISEQVEVGSATESGFTSQELQKIQDEIDADERAKSGIDLNTRTQMMLDRGLYYIEPGDTLSELSKRFGMSVGDLKTNIWPGEQTGERQRDPNNPDKIYENDIIVFPPESEQSWNLDKSDPSVIGEIQSPEEQILDRVQRSMAQQETQKSGFTDPWR
jgi:hypothetical protein